MGTARKAPLEEGPSEGVKNRSIQVWGVGGGRAGRAFLAGQRLKGQ